jgi:hypothetical protein
MVADRKGGDCAVGLVLRWAGGLVVENTRSWGGVSPLATLRLERLNASSPLYGATIPFTKPRYLLR